jgi:broad specificity phosphatase PhoE
VKKVKVHIVRHGETEANEQHRFQGHDDTPLTNSGERSAKEVAQRLAEYDFDVVFSSPLKRALDTSKLFAQQLKTDVRIAPELKEMCYGEWEGRPKDELRELDVWEQRERDKYNFSHPGEYDGVEGQSYADIFDRVAEFFDELIESDRERVLVVTHLGVLRNAKKYFEECSDADAVTFTPDVRQVYTVTVENGVAETSTLNVD